VLTEVAPQPSVADVLRAQGADPDRLAARAGQHPSGRDRYRRVVAVAEQAIARGRPLLEPRAAWSVVADWRWRAPQLAARLGDQPELRQATVLVAVAVTIGTALEHEVERVLSTDVAVGAALDGYGSCACQQLGTAALRRFQTWAAARDLTCSLPVSPGRAEWPVDVAQPELTRLVPADRIAITVNAFGHLHPRKSLSFVVGLHALGPTPARDVDLCAPCLVQTTCHWRRVGLRCRTT
jgi:hypothetical protein